MSDRNEQVTQENGSLAEMTHRLWEENAEWWDEKVGGEGNRFHRMLVVPAADHLLDLKPGEDVLEIACGNGAYARHMAARGARVLATDFSGKFLARARERSAGSAIDFRRVDATSADELEGLGEGRFDAAVCLMALMDMWTIDPLMSALPHLLKPGGRFVFALMHPCFNGNGSRLSAEIEDRNGDLVEIFSVKVSRYIRSWSERGIGIVGQPAPHFYFNRPLHELLGSCFRAGLVMDGIEEPAFPAGSGGERWASWGNFPEIPPVLVVRMRSPGAGL